MAKNDYDGLAQYPIPLILERLNFCENDFDDIWNEVYYCLAMLATVIVNKQYYEQTIEKSICFQYYLIYVAINLINLRYNYHYDNVSFQVKKDFLFRNGFSERGFNFLIETDPPLFFKKMMSVNYPLVVDETFSFYYGSNIAANDIIITLDLEKQKIRIQLGFKKLQPDIRLKMNDDHVVIKSKNKILRDFYLPIHVKPAETNASIELERDLLLPNMLSILTIECPFISL